MSRGPWHMNDGIGYRSDRSWIMDHVTFCIIRKAPLLARGTYDFQKLIVRARDAVYWHMLSDV